MSRFAVTLYRGNVNGWEVASQFFDLSRADANKAAHAMGDTIAALDPAYKGTHPCVTAKQGGRETKTYVLPTARLQIEIRSIA